MWEEGALLVRTKARRRKLALAMLAMSIVGLQSPRPGMPEAHSVGYVEAPGNETGTSAATA